MSAPAVCGGCGATITGGGERASRALARRAQWRIVATAASGEPLWLCPLCGDDALPTPPRRPPEGKFVRYFRDLLTGDELGALLRLRRAIEIQATAGAARPAYDGVSIGAIVYGAREISDAAVDAGRLIAAARAAVGRSYPVIAAALAEDLSPQEIADRLTRAGRDRSRAAAVDIVRDAAGRLTSVRVDRS